MVRTDGTHITVPTMFPPGDRPRALFRYFLHYFLGEVVLANVGACWEGSECDGWDGVFGRPHSSQITPRHTTPHTYTQRRGESAHEREN